MRARRYLILFFIALGAPAFFSCEQQITIPVKVRNDYSETITEFIMGTAHETNMRSGEVRVIYVELNTVVIRVFFESSYRIETSVTLQPHNANATFVVTAAGGMAVER